MLKRLNEVITMKRLIWVFPLVFIIHDGEELILLEGWMREHQELLAERFGEITRSLMWTTPRFAVAMTIILAIIVWSCRKAARGLPDGRGAGPYLTIVAILFINVFTHTGQMIVLGTYTPGVGTAILVGLPYALYVFYRFRAIRS
jgi:hypothetical protein